MKTEQQILETKTTQKHRERSGRSLQRQQCGQGHLNGGGETLHADNIFKVLEATAVHPEVSTHDSRPQRWGEIAVSDRQSVTEFTTAGTARETPQECHFQQRKIQREAMACKQNKYKIKVRKLYSLRKTAEEKDKTRL